MRALRQKLLRELWRHRGQMISIASVVAVGVMTVLTLRGSYESLVRSRDSYYRDSRFPDVWASLERAPESLRRRLEEIPGVAVVDTRVSFSATLDIPGLKAPAQGLFVSVPDDAASMLARTHIVSGRFPSSDRRDEAMISKKFAIANGFVPGDTLRAVINGRSRPLVVVGTAISPEFTYAVSPGSLFPDDKRFGVIWMNRQVLGPAYDMDGAFNDVAMTLGPRAYPPAVIAAVDRLLRPYGGRGAFGRDRQVSNQLLEGELESDRTMGTAIPAVFLLVAAFLLNIVLSRLIATERTEIAVLKAFGYTNFEVASHYLQFAMAAVLGGAVVGVIAGALLGRSMVELYGTYFDFPSLQYSVSGVLILLAVGTSALAAAAGAASAARRAAQLPPAEAMRPAPPASFRAGWLERIGVGRALPTAGRMILRNVERQPLRSVASMVGVAFSVAILVIGLFMFDGVQYMLDLQFNVAQREDLSLTFNQPRADAVRHDLEHLAGVTRVEVFRTVPVKLTVGHRTRVAAITGMQADGRLRRIVTAEGGTARLPPDGIVLSALLAQQLDVSVGEPVEVAVLDGARRQAAVHVANIVEDFLGISIYMDLEALQQLTRGAPSVSGAYLAVAAPYRDSLNRRLKQLPLVAGVASPAQMYKSFNDQLTQSLFIGVFFILGFSAVIAIAVVYNGARIALSERGRELASLRVLGFTRGEVGLLLLGEQALTTVAGIPLGWALGYALAAAVSTGLQTETYRIPLIISTSTFLWSAVLTAAAAVVSGWIVQRRLDRMDLIEVLKTRE